jgi:hypothetical protein
VKNVNPAFSVSAIMNVKKIMRRNKLLSSFSLVVKESWDFVGIVQHHLATKREELEHGGPVV